jgi:hypothetical protein
MRTIATYGILVIFGGALSAGASAEAIGPATPAPPAEGPPTQTEAVKQPSFVEAGGQLRKNEHAFLLYSDAKYLPAPVMVAYHYGIFYWWEMGLDVGGNYGLFQALIHLKMENFKTKRTELFYWGFVYDTGFKINDINMSRNLTFDGKDLYADDRSWVHELKNSFAFRFGQKKDKVVYLVTDFYIDQDLHTPRRQNDYYLSPANLGFETTVGGHASFFVEGGAIWAINGMETEGGVKYEGDWFPVLKLGLALRTGDRTAKD